MVALALDALPGGAEIHKSQVLQLLWTHVDSTTVGLVLSATKACATSLQAALDAEEDASLLFGAASPRLALPALAGRQRVRRENGGRRSYVQRRGWA
jgi:hypothetical protein